MLDPNKEIRGKGEWRLMEHNVEIGRFHSDLMMSLIEMNREFIRSQQQLGLRITSPADKAEWQRKLCTLTGTFVNPPGDDVLAITNVGSDWWPQPWPVRVLDEAEKKWEVIVDFGMIGHCKIYIVRANELGMQLIQFYRKMVNERSSAILTVTQRFQLTLEEARLAIAPVYWSLPMPRLPKGLEMEDCISLNVTKLEP